MVTLAPPPPPPMEVILLDGGMGHLLKQRGLLVPGLPYDQQFLAGAIANVEAADQIVAAHKEYINAGAEVITTNSEWMGVVPGL